ncbi:hypothetical protein [Dishui Lake phycodnavirus 3]|nr:hypothetical protein [Dishui Lake phycodnavirus 3]
MGLFKDCGCGCNGAKARNKFVISIISALLFFIVANPSTFIIVRRIFGAWVSSPNGCPTVQGLALHALVFFLLVWGMMHIRKEGYEGKDEEEYEIEEEGYEEEEYMINNEGYEGKDEEEYEIEEEGYEEEEYMINNEGYEGKDEEEYMINNEGYEERDEDYEIPSMNNMPTPEPYMSEVSFAPSPRPVNGQRPVSSPKLGSLDLSADMGAAPVQKRSGNYTSCKCSDGSDVVLMR